MKVLICRGVGGFWPSKMLLDRFGVLYLFNKTFGIESGNPDMWRTAPELRARVAALGDKAFKNDAYPKVIEIPEGIGWYVHEAEDGSESIHEEHRIWV